MPKKVLVYCGPPSGRTTLILGTPSKYVKKYKINICKVFYVYSDFRLHK